jgi:hypothetical protein
MTPVPRTMTPPAAAYRRRDFAHVWALPTRTPARRDNEGRRGYEPCPAPLTPTLRLPTSLAHSHVVAGERTAGSSQRSRHARPAPRRRMNLLIPRARPQRCRVRNSTFSPAMSAKSGRRNDHRHGA